ncbi:MAG: hypothetical protein JO294_01320, partial [Alphaproteobacteria bacterium]|nr:hypothetical protein [Alphaproteobacteria bacterium]
PHALSILSASGLQIVNTTLTNTGTGAVNLIAGWDGSTFGNASALTAAGAFGLNNASLLLASTINVAGTLTVGGGDIGQNTAFSAGTLFATATSGDINLGYGNAIGVLYAKTLSGGAFFGSSTAVSVAGANVAGTLFIDSAGNLTQTGAIAANLLNVTSDSGDITLTNAANTFGTVKATTSGAHDASFRTNGSLAIFGDSNVGGTLTLNAATDITQTGGAFTAATLVANSANGNIALGISAHNVGAANLTTTGSHVATLSTSGALVITGASVGGGLTLSAAGNITQTGAITSAALDARSTGGDVTLTKNGNAFGSLTTVTSSGHNASFVTGGALQVINANVGGTLSLAAGGNITQGTSINAGTLKVSSTGGSITLLNGGNNFGNLNVTTSGSFGASLFTGGSTVINSANVGGPFSLTAGNSITQTAAITTGALDVRSNGGDITLNNSGNVFSQLTVVTATGKNATLVKNGALLVVNANVGGTLSLTASGDITQGTSINAAALTLNSTGGNITLNNGGNNFANLNVTTGGSHTATLFTSGSTNVVSANVGGAFSLAAGNNITQSGAFSSGAFNVASTSGNITLNNSGNTFGTLTVTTPSGRFSNIAKSGSLVIGAASGGGSVTLSATGPVSQTGTIAAQNLTVSTTSGGINLGLATNAVTGFAAFNTPGALTFANSVVTFLGTSSIGGDTLILAQRDLVIQGGIQNNGTGNITLVSGWDGTTTDPTHFGDAGVYGNNSGSLFLNSGSVVGAKSGDL